MRLLKRTILGWLDVWSASLITTTLLALAQVAIADAPAYPNQRNIEVRSGSTESLAIPGLERGQLYGVLVFLQTLAELAENDAVTVAVADPAGIAVTKTLHAGDPDFYFTLKPTVTGSGSIQLDASSAAGEGKRFQASVSVAKMGGTGSTALAALPNSTWRQAQRMELGEAIYGSNDERPFIPQAADARTSLRDLTAGAQWFAFDYAGPGAKLVHFIVDILDRDVPVDVSLFTRSGESASAKLIPYDNGLERYNTEQSTKFHGLQKFIARVLEPGTFYVRVMANHPFYRLRTEVYDPPPYSDPERAIRVGMDYLLRNGDSWHADTPRRGSVVLRTSNRLGETAQCIACHPTQFTTRAELIAMQNGWPLMERQGLQFLRERLYNNPRPLYGDPELVWARMISAPGNVLSRVGYLLTTFEHQLSEDQRAGLLEPIGRFLAEYWNGVENPITESNGNLPRVSGFEVALHSGIVFEELFRRSGDEQYSKLRAQVEAVIICGKPIDMIDLCWKIVALCEFNRPAHAPQIDQLINELFSFQKPNGTWSVAFVRAHEKDYQSGKERPIDTPKDPDGAPKQSEFQTYHALYALAKAGIKMDDQRIARSVQWCLSRQWPHGGWQGNPDFKNFDTVFRDTQYAVMALSELCKGPGAHGWDAGFRSPPADFPTNDVAATLAAMDQYWTDPGPAIRSKARSLLTNEQPLVRFAAVSMFGRIGDAESVDALAASLGDGSKLVQRGAAWALRQIVSRRGRGHEAILRALQSRDDRTRWGALRIFNQHFKYLTTNWEVGESLLVCVQHDPVAVNRMQAAQALWQWWFWDGTETHRSQIEDVFIARLAAREHPWVRRNLIEGLHNVLDDNVRYLYNDWIPALKSDSTQQRIKVGQRASALRQATKIALVLSRGNDLQRDGLLRSYYAFHLRETAAEMTPEVLHFPFPETYLREGKVERGENTWLEGYQFAASFDPATAGTGILGRIGNDTEPPTYYEDSGPVLANALAPLLEADRSESILPVLKVYRSTRGLPMDGTVSARLLQSARRIAADQAHEAELLLRELLPGKFTASSESIVELADVIEKETGWPLALAGMILRDGHNAALAQDPDIVAALRKRAALGEMPDADREVILDLLLTTPELQGLDEVRSQVLTLSRSGSDRLRNQALRTLLLGDRFLLSSRARKDFESDLDAASPTRMREWLAAAASLDWKSYRSEAGTQIVLGTVTTGLTSTDAAVRRAALEAVRAIAPLRNNPAVRESLRLLAEDQDGQVREATKAVTATLEHQPRTDPRGAASLDFNYFVKQVQPIFLRPATDGDSCARCHANHAILRLRTAGPDQPLSEEQSRSNYLSALKVVDLINPEESLLLIKPRSSFEGIGQPEKYRSTHGGDVRWPAGTQSQEYQTILRWIEGAKDPES